MNELEQIEQIYRSLVSTASRLNAAEKGIAELQEKRSKIRKTSRLTIWISVVLITISLYAVVCAIIRI